MSAIVWLGRGTWFVSFLPIPSYSHPRQPLPQCGLQRTPAFPWVPKRCQDAWNFWRNSLPEEVSWEMVKWQGSRLCCECQSTFLYSSAISQQDCERNRASFQEGTKVPVDVKTSGCQDNQERFWQVPLALAFVRNLEGVWLIALWLKQHKPKDRMHYAMKASRMITHQVRALNTKCPKDIKGFPSMYTTSWEGRNSSLGSLI